VTGIIEHLYTQLVTTSNYSAIANLHNLRITRTHSKSSQSACKSRSLVTNFNNRNSSVSMLKSLPAG
jgi:hypothetical protein